ncbi:hypothetical protein ACH4OW_26170 [Streptomyces sp. NPDC017056]|uniref:hypothetical protein n=1 Tax=Streptomyces sp. NPDC017056 TaxID=3364973 RepID=UPI0037ABC477
MTTARAALSRVLAVRGPWRPDGLDLIEAFEKEVQAAGTCDASATGASVAEERAVFGPCVLRRGHDGPVHQDADGRRWAGQGEQPGGGG